MKWPFIVLSVILICRSTVSSVSKENKVKEVVDILQSFNKPSHVIANLCWERSTIKKLACNLAESKNPTSVKLVDDVNAKDLLQEEKVIFLVDAACKGVMKFLNKAKARKYFGRPHRWLVMNRPNVENVIPPELDAMDILTDSEVYISRFGNNSYDINLIYKTSPSRDWIIEKYGTWSTERGLIVSKHVMEFAIAIRRRNLRRDTVVTSTVVTDNSTLGDLELMRYKEIDSVTKSTYNQLTALYEFTNATRKLIFTDSWGYITNGTWTGMLGHLSQGKADLPGLMFMSKERMPLVDYLSYPTPSSVRFIFREPPLSYQNNLYLLPFKASVWYCIGSFVVVLIVALYVNAYWDARKTGGDEKQNKETTMLIPTVSDVTVFVMSAISQQGSNVELKGTLGRFVIFILLLVFLFLYTAYSASIVVLLQSSSNQIRTLSDLLNSKLELGVEDTPYNRYFFTSAKDPIRKAIYEKKVAPSGTKPKFFEIVEGVQQLQKKPFAFHCNLGSSYKLIEKYFYEHEKCGLQEISYIQENYPWQGVRRGTPYREIFKLATCYCSNSFQNDQSKAFDTVKACIFGKYHAEYSPLMNAHIIVSTVRKLMAFVFSLLRNSEFGMNDRINRIMYSKKPVCTVRGGSFVSVSFVDCYPILLLLLYGMILGVLLLFAEVLHHRKISASPRP